MVEALAVFEDTSESCCRLYLHMHYYCGGDMAHWLRATPAPAPLRRKVLLLQLAMVRYIRVKG